MRVGRARACRGRRGRTHSAGAVGSATVALVAALAASTAAFCVAVPVAVTVAVTVASAAAFCAAALAAALAARRAEFSAACCVRPAADTHDGGDPGRKASPSELRYSPELARRAASAYPRDVERAADWIGF